MIHAVRADRHPRSIEFSQSLSIETARRAEPACEDEERRGQAPLAQRFERHLDVGGIAVVEADPGRRARGEDVEHPEKGIGGDPIPRLARLELPPWCADAVEADAVDRLRHGPHHPESPGRSNPAAPHPAGV